jgi:hypothetical protein
MRRSGPGGISLLTWPRKIARRLFSQEDLPDWMDQAWSILDADPVVEDALLAFHEGLVLQQEGHESFAMIAFVASIEALGTQLGELRRCPECSTVIGSADRFRRALAFVMPEEARRRALAKVVYGKRSTTAHAGRLHGAEAAPGALPFAGSFFSRDSVWEFTLYLHETRQASRELLLRVLRDRLELSADVDRGQAAQR